MRTAQATVMKPPAMETPAMETPADDSRRSDLTIAYSRDRQRAAWADASDAELLEGMRGDDDLALDELMRRKTGHLLHVTTQLVNDTEDARDIVQAAFLRIWDSRHRFNRRYSPNTWIYRIVHNLAIDHLRSRASRLRSLKGLKQHHEQQQQGRGAKQLDSLSERETGAVFRELAAVLTGKQRAVFILREMEDLSGKEIAAILGIRPSTVRNHLFNARRLLRQRLLDRYPEYGPRSDSLAGRRKGR